MVAVSEWLLEQMRELSDEYFRLLLYFQLAEHRAGIPGRVPGIAVPFVELAEGAGLSQGRALSALNSLELADKVERLPDGSWRLK
jgi:DNA-binding IclR family transcriptional regulator